MPKEELKNSPLHGLSSEIMLTELVEFYGWNILDAAIDLKCFRIEPTIPSCLIFLKRAEWARNRVEDFYLYCFKGMPKGDESDALLKPRERGFPNGVLPRDPMPLTAKDAYDLRPVDESRPERKKRPPVYEEPEPFVETPPEESTFKSRFSRPRR